MPVPDSQLGRIGGQLLTDNLLRAGVDIAVETSLLYLDVTNKRVGVKTSAPTHPLQINGTTRAPDVIVDGTSARVNNVIINTNGSFSTLVGALNITPTGGPSIVISHERVVTNSLDINDNYIRGRIADRNFELRPNGTGDTKLNGNTYIDENLLVSTSLFAQQNVNVKGIFTIGDTSFDTLTVVPDFTQSIIPGDNDLYDLGTLAKKWRVVYVNNNNHIDGFTSITATISDQVFMAGNTIGTLQSNDDLVVSSTEGTITLNNLSIKDDTITNLLPTPTTITHTGNGYLQIAGTFGFQMPHGTTLERPSSPETGITRWNTELSYLECFDGTVWGVATGGGETVTEQYMEDLSHIYTLVLG
jgi:hypothetical protein